MTFGELPPITICMWYSWGFIHSERKPESLDGLLKILFEFGVFIKGYVEDLVI